MEFKEGLTVGIDLGTTFSTLAYLGEDGTPIPVTNEEGAEETPSVILVTDSGHVVVGPSRMRAAMEEPEHVIDRVKRHMGESDDQFKTTFDGKQITPEFLSALILKKLRQDAEKQIGKIGNAVITVPYYFNDIRRKATQDAGRIAGINVIDIINEPTAATLTYAWKRNELGASSETGRSREALIYDLGGGTFDVTVVRYTPTHFRVLATDGDVMLGGIDWNDRLVDHVAEKFQDEHGVDFRDSAATVQIVHYECDQAKLALSDNKEATISCRHEGQSLSVTVTRREFEQLTADLTQRTIDTAELVLEQAKLRHEDLDAVVMVGGSTMMPIIQRRIAESLHMEPYQNISPFTSVAQGAAIHAAILEAKHRGTESKLADHLKKMLASVEQEDVNSHGLGIATRNPVDKKSLNYVMIPRNTQLPAEKRHTFVTREEGQRRVHVEVIQGEAPDPAACAQIGDLRITDLPEGLPKGSKVDVIYKFDEAGRIHVEAQDMTSGLSATTEIERAGALNEDEIDAYARLAAEYKVE